MKAKWHGEPYWDFKEKKYLITFETTEKPSVFDKTRDKELSLDISEYFDHRSGRANRYMWELVGKIADSLRSSKDEIYIRMLKRYGQSEIVSVLSEIDVSGYFKYYEPIAEVTLQGKEFTHYKVFKGSSEYDTREMSILIDGVVSEAKELGIETLPPNELERMKQAWKVS